MQLGATMVFTSPRSSIAFAVSSSKPSGECMTSPPSARRTIVVRDGSRMPMGNRSSCSKPQIPSVIVVNMAVRCLRLLSKADLTILSRLLD